jgi:hypothetical protein
MYVSLLKHAKKENVRLFSLFGCKYKQVLKKKLAKVENRGGCSTAFLEISFSQKKNKNLCFIRMFPLY